MLGKKGSTFMETVKYFYIGLYWISAATYYLIFNKDF